MKTSLKNLCFLQIMMIFIINSSISGVHAQSLHQLEQQLDTMAENKEKAQLYLDLAWEYLYIEPEKTKFYAAELLKLGKKQGLLQAKSSAYGLFGLYYEFTGNYEESIRSYHKAISTINGIDSLRSNLSGHLANLAIVYHFSGNYNNAIKYAEKALDIHKEYKDTARMIDRYNSLGNSYSKINEIHKAINCYERALELNKERDANNFAIINSNLADLYLGQKEYEKALNSYLIGYNYAYNHDHATLPDKLDANIDMATFYLKTNNLPQGKKYLNEAKKLLPKVKNPDLELTIYSLMAEYYAGGHDYENAYFYYKKSNILSDSIRGVEVQSIIAELQNKYQNEQNKAQITGLKTASQLKDLALSKQKSQKVSLAILTLVVTIMLLITIAFLKLARKNSRRLKMSNDIVLQKHQEIEELMRESHHRIKNNLQVISSLLKLQSKNVQSPLARAALLEAYNRIKTIAVMHQNLQGSRKFESIPIHEFIVQLAENIRQSLTARNSGIRITTELETVEMETDKSLSIGLIINELIVNSLKYAFINDEGIIRIQMKLDQENILFEISDNGMGFPENFDPVNDGSLGFRIINSLTSKLHGKLVVNTDEGAHIQITIPYEQAA